MLATVSRGLFSLTVLFQLSTLTGFAQVSTMPAPRWYIKAAPTLALHPFIVQNYEIGAYLIGGTFSGGYSITPKLTLQTGVLHGRGGSLDDNFFDDGTPKYVADSYKESVWGVPTELRYSFSEPTRRFRVEGIVGASVYSVRLTRTHNQLITNTSKDGWYPVVSHAKDVNGFMSFGVGFCYAVNPHLNTSVDLSLNTNMQQFGYYGIGLGAGTALGIAYRFR